MNMVLKFLVKNWRRLPMEEFRVPSHLSFVAAPRWQGSHHIIFFILADGQADPILVVKVPRLSGDNTRLDREADNLRTIQAARFDGFSSIPRVITYEDCFDNRLLIETALAGQTMSPSQIRRQPKPVIEAVLAWLVSLHLATRQRGEDVGRWFEPMVRPHLEVFEKAFPLSAEDKTLIAQTCELTDPLRDADLPFVFEHGDLDFRNILITEAGSLGVVSWESANPGGFPALDLFYFLTCVAFALRRARKLVDCLEAFHEAFFGPTAWAQPYVVRYAKGLCLSSEVVKALFLLCWSRYVAHIIIGHSHGPLEQDTTEWLRVNRYYALWNHAVHHAKDLKFG